MLNAPKKMIRKVREMKRMTGERVNIKTGSVLKDPGVKMSKKMVLPVIDSLTDSGTFYEIRHQVSDQFTAGGIRTAIR